jgi:hypothetical protein
MRFKLLLSIGQVMTLCCAILSAVPATAQTFDPAVDFSTSANPSGVWSYGWTQTLGSSFILDAIRENNSGLDFWEGSIVGDPRTLFPYVVHNGTDSTIAVFGTVSVAAGQLGLHPGPGGEYSVVRWTAPAPGSYSVTAAFRGIDFGPTTTDVHVLQNGVSLFDGAVSALGSGPTYVGVQSISTGDTIDFVVGYGANQTYFNDSTGLAASIVAAQPAQGVSFSNIHESSGTDPVPLFGPPSQFPGGLDFNPKNFVAYAHDGGTDMTDGQLSFTATSSNAIQSISLSEAGDYSLVGDGTSATHVRAAGDVFVTVTAINGLAVAPIDLYPSYASAQFDLVDNPGIVQRWSLGAVVDIAGQLPAGQNATKINVVIDNKLTAVSELGTVGLIEKKDFIVRVDALVPEPSAALLAALAAACWAARKRTSRRAVSKPGVAEHSRWDRYVRDEGQTWEA